MGDGGGKFEGNVYKCACGKISKTKASKLQLFTIDLYSYELLVTSEVFSSPNNVKKFMGEIIKR